MEITRRLIKVADVFRILLRLFLKSLRSQQAARRTPSLRSVVGRSFGSCCSHLLKKSYIVQILFSQFMHIIAIIFLIHTSCFNGMKHFIVKENVTKLPLLSTTLVSTTLDFS